MIRKYIHNKYKSISCWCGWY